MRSKKANAKRVPVVAGLTIAAATALLSAGVGAQMTEDDEIVDIQKVPIEQVMRVTRADGNVFYTTADRRWLIAGEIIDMWTGRPEHELDAYDSMRWERTGTTLDQIQHPGREMDTSPKAALFIPLACAECAEGLTRLKEAELLDEVSLAPFAGTLDPPGWGRVWCERSFGVDRAIVLIQNKVMLDTQKNCEAIEKSGRVNALAQVFKMDADQLTLISKSGEIVRGREEIMKWAGEQR